MQFIIIIEPYEDKMKAESPALPGVSAFGDTPEEALLEYSKVLTGCMEVMIEDGDKLF